MRWQLVAKDGADLPEGVRASGLAQQVIAMGETYDFAYTPAHAGWLSLQVWGRNRLLIRVPIRVE